MTRMLPSGESAKKALSIGNLLKLLGLIALTAWGVTSDFIEFGYQSYETVAPQVTAAKDEISQYMPAVPGFQVQVGERTFTLYEGSEAGSAYARMTGNSGSSGVLGGNGSSDNLAPSIEDLVGQYTATTPEDATEKTAQYEALKTQLLSLVGTNDGISPSFGSLEAFSVETARQLLAAMRANGSNLVEPSQWASQLETAVQGRYTSCFQAKNLECLRDWNDVQTEVSINPLGLEEWITDLASDDAALDALLTYASNSNAESLAQGALSDMYTEAVAARITLGCQRIDQQTATALDYQWCWSNQLLYVTVNEGWDAGGWVGGNKGILDDNDIITVRHNTGQLTVPYVWATQVFPGLTPRGANVQMPAQPALWNPTTNPWVPNSPLP